MDLKFSLLHLIVVSILWVKGVDDVFARWPDAATGPVAFIIRLLNFLPINIYQLDYCQLYK